MPLPRLIQKTIHQTLTCLNRRAVIVTALGSFFIDEESGFFEISLEKVIVKSQILYLSQPQKLHRVCQ